MLNHNMKLEQLFSLSPSSQSSTNSQHHHHQPNTSTSSSTCSSTAGGSSTSVQHQQNPTGPMSHQQHHPNMQSQQQHQFPQQMMQRPPPHPSMMGPMGVHPFPLLGGLPPQMGLPPPPGLGPGAVLPPPAMFPHHPFGGMGAVLPPPPPPSQQPRMPVSPQHHIPFPVAQMMAGPRLPPMVPPQMQNLSASSGSMLPNNQHHQQQPQDQSSSSQGFSFSQTTQQQHIQLIQSLIHNTRVNYVQQHQQQQMQLMQAVAAAAASANASPVRMNPNQNQNQQQQQQEVTGTRTSPNTGQMINGSHSTSFANGLQNDSQSNGLSTNSSASNSATNSQMLHSLMQQQQKAQHQQQQQKLYQQMVLQQAQESARVQALREQSRRALMESTLPARGTIASSILESVLESESKKEQEMVEEFRQHKQKQQQQQQNLQQNQNQSRQLPSEVEVGSLIPNSNATVEALFKSVAIKQEIEDDDDSNGASNAAKVEALFKSFLPGFVPLPATPPRAPTSAVQSQQKQHHSHILPRSTLSPPPPSAEAELLEEIDLKQLAIPQDVMDDLASRFVLNMPGEEKDDPIRICFQIEIAFWFYVDFFCETFANLPKMKLKRFAYIMFTYIPRLRRFLDVFDQVITNWIDYKFSIPCSGAVLLDKSLEYVLLVQGYGSRNWSFPKGKVNHDETLMNCAIREVLEETGYDCTDNIFESTYLERKIFESACRLFIVTDVEMDYHFRPHVRNEIRNIQWFLVSELPMKVQKKANGAVNGNGNNSKAVNGNSNGNGGQAQQANIASKFFTVYPFVYSIRKWIERERKKRRRDARLERRNRKRTISNGNGTNSEAELSAINGGASSSGAISSDDHDVSCSNSPYTVVECPSANESTSFVDVKLDDILGTTPPTASGVGSASGSILDKSLHGLSVFNADRGDEPEVDSRAGVDLDDVDDHIKRHQGGIGGGGGDWPSTWQSLVNEYNRRNPIHTPIGYDLMSADGGGGAGGSIVAPSPTPSGAFKLEDIEKHHVTTTPPTTSGIDGSLGSLFGASSTSANGGESLTCDDKLNFLFSFATKQQQEVAITTNSGTSSTTASDGGDISKLLNDISNSINNSNSNNSNQSGQMIYSTTINKQSPFGAIGSKSGATSGTATSVLNTSGSSVKTKTPEPPKLPSINNAANTTNQPSTNQNGSAALSALFSFTSVTTTSTTTSGSVAVPVATPQGGGGISPNVSSFFASAQQHLNNNGSTDQSTKSSTPTPPPIIVGSVTSNGSSSISTATPKILEADEEDEEEVNFASASEDSSQEEKRKKQQQQQQNSYNGFDAKNVPVIEDKIRKLIDRLRFLHN